MDLQSVRRLKEKIDDRREQIETLKTATLGVYRLDGLPRAKAQASPTEKVAAAIVDAESELDALIAELDAVAATLAKEILARVGGLRGRVLILRYVACMKFCEVADALKLSQARIYALHSEGVKKFNSAVENFCNERSGVNDSDRNKRRRNSGGAT